MDVVVQWDCKRSGDAAFDLKLLEVFNLLPGTLNLFEEE
jgi:hypothetical protein